MFVRASVQKKGSSHRRQGESEDMGKRHTRRGSSAESVDPPPPQPSRGRPPAVVVSPSSLQMTFENLRSVISSAEEASFSKETVVQMVDSLYCWMVFDKDSQLVVPSVPGSATTKKMWPHGSTIDTRKRADDGDRKSDPRCLRDIAEDEASAVASSIVSSNVEDEPPKPMKNSVVYRGARAPTEGAQTSHYPYGTYPTASLATQGRQPAYQYEYQPYVPHYHGNARPSNTLGHHHLKQGARYSMVAGEVEAPAIVPETPMSSHPEPSARRVRKKTAVGAASRTTDEGEGGDNVVFVDD